MMTRRRKNPLRHGALAMLCLAFMTALATTAPAAPGIDDSLDEPASASVDGFVKDVVGKTTFKLVPIDAPNTPLAQRLFWRPMPAAIAATTTPPAFKIGSAQFLAPVADPALLPREHDYAYPTEAPLPIKDGSHVITPGGITIEQSGGKIRSSHPAVLVSGNEVRIRCAPVRFDAVGADGSPRPFKLEVNWNETPLLREPGASFSSLVIYLPVGTEYRSTLGAFSLGADGKFQARADTLKDGVEARVDGLRLKVPASEGKPATLPAGAMHLLAHRGRSVFTEQERSAAFFVLLGGPAPARQARILCQPAGTSTPLELGSLTLPALAGPGLDSRGFTVDMSALPTGDYTLCLDAGPQKSATQSVTIVPWRERSSFFVHTMSGCTTLWPTTDEGLALLHDAGIEMGSGTGHRSVLDAQMPRPAPGADHDVPELAMTRPENDVLLERMLRHQIRLVDLTPLRDAGLYLETLSYHHSFAPSVERLARHMSVYAQQTGDFPSFWGVNYTWYPMLHGYAEGGVPTDAHVAERNRALAEAVKASGATPISAEDRAWYLEHRRSQAPADRARALSIQDRAIAYFLAEGELGWAKHNKIYNDAVRRARPGTACLLYENSGHNTDKQVGQMFSDMTASAYESYTDYGDWPMSAGWTTDFTLAEAPGRPVWLTTCWGTSAEGQQKSLLHAFMRGLAGGGVPMQADQPLPELARRGKGLKFISQYGPVATTSTPDRRVAILATDAKKLFGVNQSFDYHAIYTHLTRLGVAPTMLTERELLARGVPASVRALLVVQEEDPLGEKTLAAIAAFQQAGGKVAAIGENSTPIPGAISVPQKVDNLWDLAGFTPAVHAQLWTQFREVWRPRLSELLPKLGIEPLASTDPSLAYTLVSQAGAVRFVAVIADVEGQHSDVFEPTPDLPVKLAGEGWKVRDLVKQVDLPATSRNGVTETTVQLLTEPTTLLAIYKEAPAAIRLRIGEKARVGGALVFSAQPETAAGAAMTPIPMRLALVDSTGTERGQWFRASGDAVTFPLPALASPGQWKIVAQELITGVTVEQTVEVAPSVPAAVAAAMETVQVVAPDQVQAFLKKPGEKILVIEANQSSLAPVADRLAAALAQAGARVRVWRTQPEEFTSIPTRWFPRPADLENLRLIDAAKLIGFRQDLKPYIDAKARSHVPELGGYAEIDPRFMTPFDLIVFRGGQLADSLASVSAWAGSPNIPGRGQGRLLTVFSPFTAGKDVVAVLANDADGFERSARRLAELATEKLPEPAAAAPPVMVESRPAPRVAPVAKPYERFTPYRRIERLLASADGKIAAILRGKKNTLAMLDAGGKVTAMVAPDSAGPASAMSMDAQGRVWSLARGGADGATLFAVTGDGKSAGGLAAWPGDFSELSHRYEAGFAVAPDGVTALLGRPGGLLLGKIGGASWLRYDDLSRANFRFEVLYPRLPLSVTFSPDSSVALVSWDTRAPLNSMGGPLATPTAPETTLIDVATGKAIWRLRGAESAGGAYTVYNGFAAMSRDGGLAAMFDYTGVARVVGRDGKIVVEKQIAEPEPGDAQRSGPPRGVGADVSRDGALAAFATTQKLMIARGRAVTLHSIAGIHSLSVAPDGSLVLLGLDSGEVLALGPDGQKNWSLRVGETRPVVKALENARIAAGSNDGVIVLIDGTGKELSRTPLLPAADQLKNLVKPAEFQRVPDYAEPDTLALAQSRLKAKKIEEWKPAGEATEAFGRRFFAMPEPIVFGPVSGVNDRLLHLVYRKPSDAAVIKVTLQNGAASETFLLDLPAPEFRVVDLPMRGAGATAKIEASGPVLIAEASVWSMQYPGANLALVTPASEAGMGAKGGGGGDELDSLVSDAATSGRMKETRIYWPNSDPDRVKGQFLPPRFNPLLLVDGKSFGSPTPPPMAEKSQYAALFGGFVTIDFGASVEVGLVAVYDRVNRQSEVNRAIGVFTDFSPEQGQIGGKVLAGRTQNDQFWRLIALPEKTAIRQLGVHVFVDAKSPCGLREVEAYR